MSMYNVHMSILLHIIAQYIVTRYQNCIYLMHQTWQNHIRMGQIIPARYSITLNLKYHTRQMSEQVLMLTRVRYAEDPDINNDIVASTLLHVLLEHMPPLENQHPDVLCFQ